MEHHRDFNVYHKHKGSERIVDTLLFKLNHITSSIVTPEDTVLEATKRLTYAVIANCKSTESEQME